MGLHSRQGTTNDAEKGELGMSPPSILQYHVAASLLAQVYYISLSSLHHVPIRRSCHCFSLIVRYLADSRAGTE